MIDTPLCFCLKSDTPWPITDWDDNSSFDFGKIQKFIFHRYGLLGVVQEESIEVAIMLDDVDSTKSLGHVTVGIKLPYFLVSCAPQYTSPIRLTCR